MNQSIVAFKLLLCVALLQSRSRRHRTVTSGSRNRDIMYDSVAFDIASDPNAEGRVRAFFTVAFYLTTKAMHTTHQRTSRTAHHPS